MASFLQVVHTYPYIFMEISWKFMQLLDWVENRNNTPKNFNISDSFPEAIEQQQKGKNVQSMPAILD